MATHPLVLVALLALVSAVAAAESQADLAAELREEATIMLKLRESMHAADPVGSAGMFGWQPGNTAHHCGWLRVQCDPQGRLVALQLGVGDPARPENKDDPTLTEAAVAAARNTSSSSPAPRGPLLPELAQLRSLQRLDMLQPWMGVWDRPLAGVPSEWFQPGAFPKLRQMTLVAHSLAEPLPPVHPGALPALSDLHLYVPMQRMRLPPSWGADSAVFPSLTGLTLSPDIEGPLPPEWALGFQRLETLEIINGGGEPLTGYMERQASEMARLGRGRPPAPARTPAEGQGTLPREWASGFPALRELTLTDLRLEGSLPDEWLSLTAFPSLHTLAISNCSLSGTLPASFFSTHRDLRYLRLRKNRLTGTLPDEWAGSQALLSLQLDGNRLSGPVFPPAWLQNGRFAELITYDVSGNTQLTGMLPPNLHWPKLVTLRLADTNVSGTIPERWCRSLIRSPTFVLGVDGTRVTPDKPSCLRRAYGLAGEQPAHSASAWISLAVLLPLAALVVAGGTGRLLWQRHFRKGQQGDGQPEEPGELEMLVQRPRRRHQLSSSSGTTADIDSLSSELPASLGAGGPAGRQRRVTAMLETRRRGIQMLPMEAFSDVAAHQLVSRMRAPPHSMAAGRAASADNDRLVASGAPLLPAGSAADVQTMAGQWRLATESLRVAQEALEFVADEHGELVVLGTGTHAVVYLAMLKGQRVAVKAFELGPDMDSGLMWQEVALLRNCQHPRVVQLLGVAVEEELVLMATELAERGSLSALLRDPAMQDELRWGARGRQVAVDVAEALDYLHTQLHVLHSDLKAANVLISDGWRASVSDLGMAQVLAGSARTAVGFSRVYAAPEQLLGQRCTLVADMYSFGVLLAFLTTTRHGDRRGEWRMPEAPDDCPEEVVALIAACISPDPAARPSAAEALRRLRDAPP